MTEEALNNMLDWAGALLTRGQALAIAVEEFVDTLDSLPKDTREQILALTPLEAWEKLAAAYIAYVDVEGGEIHDATKS